MQLAGSISEQGFKAFGAESPLVHGQKKPRLWVITADEGIAKIYLRENDKLSLIGEAVPDDSLQRDLTNIGVGRVVSSGGGGTVRHKYEPHMDAGRQDGLEFAHDLVAFLEKAIQADALDQIALFFAPRMLGYVRSALPEAVRARIVAEIDKDYTKSDLKILEKKVGDLSR